MASNTFLIGTIDLTSKSVGVSDYSIVDKDFNMNFWVKDNNIESIVDKFEDQAKYVDYSTKYSRLGTTDKYIDLSPDGRNLGTIQVGTDYIHEDTQIYFKGLLTDYSQDRVRGSPTLFNFTVTYAVIEYL